MLTPEVESLRDVILWAIEAEQGREYKARMMKGPAMAKARAVLRQHGVVIPKRNPPGRTPTLFTSKG